MFTDKIEAKDFAKMPKEYQDLLVRGHKRPGPENRIAEAVGVRLDAVEDASGEHLSAVVLEDVGLSR